MWINLEMDEKQTQKIKDFLGDNTKIFKKIIEKSLSKVGREIKKIEIRYIKNNYEIDSSILTTNFKLEKGNGEVALIASKKKLSIDNYYISQRKPKAMKTKILSSVSKLTAPKEMKTMFWAYYKGGAGKLMKRDGKESYKISPVYSLSISQLGRKATEEEENLIEKKITEVFHNEIENQFQKELLKI